MHAPIARTCVVLQPGYLPWLGFFEQMHRADVFVYLDDVPFDKHGWRNRNRIKGPAGAQWLTVPVRLRGMQAPNICNVAIDPDRPGWAAKHLKTLRMHYGPCAHFDWLFPDLERLLTRPWQRIAELDIALATLLCNKLGITRTTHRSSQLSLSTDRCQRLVDFCRQFDCDHYYTGAAARDYLGLSVFAAAGIRVTFQAYEHPTYPQRYGDFVSHLSVVDLMFHCGPDSLATIVGGGTPDEHAVQEVQHVH